MKKLTYILVILFTSNSFADESFSSMSAASANYGIDINSGTVIGSYYQANEQGYFMSFLEDDLYCGITSLSTGQTVKQAQKVSLSDGSSIIYFTAPFNDLFIATCISNDKNSSSSSMNASSCAFAQSSCISGSSVTSFDAGLVLGKMNNSAWSKRSIVKEAIPSDDPLLSDWQEFTKSIYSRGQFNQ